MGFGIPDEVLEKIIIEPWLLPSEIGNGATRFCNEVPTRTYDSYRPVIDYSRFRQVVVSETATAIPPNDSVAQKEQENAAFIKSVLYVIRSAFSDGLYDGLYSLEIKHLFDNIKEYFETVFSVLRIPADADKLTPAREKQSKDYLFHGIADQVFFLISHDDLDKVHFRNIVRDFILLKRTWDIGETKEPVKKKAFFQYYISEFGLTENRFHCCPSCGGKLYIGISNCPSCFKNVREHTARNASIEHIVEEISENRADEAILELRKLREQLQIAQETIERQKSELQFQTIHTNELEQQNAVLQESNYKKEQAIQEKDRAIHAYKQHITGIEEDDATHLKILVVGEYQLPKIETVEIVENIGIGLSYDNFEFFDEYGKIKNLAARIKGDSRYAAIIVGAVPHKVKNLDGASSLAALFKREGYPFTVEARTYQGELKLTRQSFQRALTQVAGNLIANARI